MRESGAARLPSSGQAEHFPDKPGLSSVIGGTLGTCCMMGQPSPLAALSSGRLLVLFGEQTRLREIFGGIYWDCCGGEYCSDKEKQEFLKYWLS